MKKAKAFKANKIMYRLSGENQLCLPLLFAALFTFSGMGLDWRNEGLLLEESGGSVKIPGPVPSRTSHGLQSWKRTEPVSRDESRWIMQDVEPVIVPDLARRSIRPPCKKKDAQTIIQKRTQFPRQHPTQRTACCTCLQGGRAC